MVVPPCQCFSVASIGRYWEAGHPKNQKTLDAIALHAHSLQLISDLAPKWFFIENPRGMLRKQRIMSGLTRHTVTYCQYGSKCQKPTDIWTNYPDPKFKRPCSPGDKCHEPAPRQTKNTGIQALANDFERSKIPGELCAYIAQICSEKPKIRTLFE